MILLNFPGKFKIQAGRIRLGYRKFVIKNGWQRKHFYVRISNNLEFRIRSEKLYSDIFANLGPGDTWPRARVPTIIHSNDFKIHPARTFSYIKQYFPRICTTSNFLLTIHAKALINTPCLKQSRVAIIYSEFVNTAERKRNICTVRRHSNACTPYNASFRSWLMKFLCILITNEKIPSTHVSEIAVSPASFWT